MEKSLYEMKLHSLLYHNGREILRVPGGWVYTYVFQGVPTSTFVPFNNEFQK